VADALLDERRLTADRPAPCGARPAGYYSAYNLKTLNSNLFDPAQTPPSTDPHRRRTRGGPKNSGPGLKKRMTTAVESPIPAGSVKMPGVPSR
jgi:hypothetical protein